VGIIRRLAIVAVVTAFAATPIAAELCVTACLPRAEAAVMPSCHETAATATNHAAAGAIAFTTAGDCHGHVSVDTIVPAKAAPAAMSVLATTAAFVPPQANRAVAPAPAAVMRPPGGPPPSQRVPLRI
jgi:hypothetical protein